MKAYYIFDSYCGWCYGFETILKPFIEAHPELEVTVLSGGLFMDGHSLSAFPYMSDTNKRIADMFGVEFGKPYLNLLETGSMVPDSNDAAIGFGVLRSFLPKGEHVNLASKMHEAFYLDGMIDSGLPSNVPIKIDKLNKFHNSYESSQEPNEEVLAILLLKNKMDSGIKVTGDYNGVCVDLDTTGYNLIIDTGCTVAAL